MKKEITITPVRVADLLAEGERMPVYVHIIDHPDARVLVDTGMTELHPAVADMDPRLSPLNKQDFDLAGIDIVVNTHLHFDHCRQADLRPASGARRRAQPGRLHYSRVGRCARRAVCAGRRRVRTASQAPARPGARPHRRHADGRHRDWRASDHRRRRRGGLVRRARGATHRRSTESARARPRVGLAHTRGRAVATSEGPMRKVTFAINITLDGYCGHESGIADDELHEYFTGRLRDSGVQIFGRNIYHLMYPYWHDVAVKQSETEVINEFARTFDSIPKLVFSTTLKSVEWNNQYDAPPLKSSRRDLEVKTTARKKHFHWQPEHRIASCTMGSHRRVSPCLSPGHRRKRSPLVRIGEEPYIKSCWGKNVSFRSCCATL